MVDKSALAARKRMEAEKARLLAQAAAIDRDMTELDRIVAKYSAIGSAQVEPISGPQTNHANRSQGLDGTLASLMLSYRTDNRSSYRKLRHATRTNYDSLLRRLKENCGHYKLADLKRADIQRLYEDWTADGKIVTGRALIGM